MNRFATHFLTLAALFALALWTISLASPALAQQTHEVEAGQNTILDAVAQAQPGDTIMLTTDGGAYENDDEIKPDIPLTFMAKPGLAKRPVLTNNGADGTKDIFRLYNDLTLIGLEIDGLNEAKYGIRTGSSSGDAANVKQDYVLKITNCHFRDIVAGSDGNAFRAYGMTMADSIVVKNSLFENMGKEALRARDEDSDRPGFGFFNVKYFEVSNSTFWNIKNDAISVYGGDQDTATPGPEVVIDHVTIYNAGHYVLNLKFAENAKVTNSILVGNYDIVNATMKTLGAPWLETGAEIAYTDTLNVSDDGEWTGGGMPTVNMLHAVDPMFADADNGDFTLSGDSPLIGKGKDGATLGDMRWWPAGMGGGSTVHKVAAGQNTLLDAVGAAAAGDVIELTDSGGEYLNDSHIQITVPLTVRAAEGLAEKPVIKNNEEDQSTRVVFRIYDDLTLQGIEIDGQAGTDFNAKYLLRIDDNDEGASPQADGLKLLVVDSYLHDVVAGSDGNFLRQYAGTLAESVIFRNVVLNNSGKEGIRIKDESSDNKAMGIHNVNYFEVSNSTIANTKADGIYVHGGDEDPNTPEPMFKVDGLTCFNCGSGNGRAIFASNILNATITNSILAHSNQDTEGSVLIEGNSSITYSNLFEVSPLKLSSGATESNNLMVDPMFADSEMLDFTIGNDMLLTASSTGGPIGDPQWATPVVSTEDDIVLPSEIALGQNYPNPFNGQTTIPYRIDEPGMATLEVYDMLGRQVMNVMSAHHAAGEYAVDISLDGHATGLYVYRLRVNDQVQHRTLTLLK